MKNGTAARGFGQLSSSIDRDTGFFIFEGGGQHIDDGKTDIVGKGWHHIVAVRQKGVSRYMSMEKRRQRGTSVRQWIIQLR